MTALTTVETTVSPEDGWVEAAAVAASVRIKPHATARAWYVAVTDGSAPAAGLVGYPMGRGRAGDQNEFSIGSVPGKVFVRVPAKPDSTSPLLFTIIKDV